MCIKSETYCIDSLILSMLLFWRTDKIEHPLLLTECPCNPLYSRSKMAELLFETYNIPSLGEFFSIEQTEVCLKLLCSLADLWRQYYIHTMYICCFYNLLESSKHPCLKEEKQKENYIFSAKIDISKT